MEDIEQHEPRKTEIKLVLPEITEVVTGRLRIESPGPSPVGTRVYLDGVEVEKVVSVSLKIVLDEPISAMIEVVV